MMRRLWVGLAAALPLGGCLADREPPPAQPSFYVSMANPAGKLDSAKLDAHWAVLDRAAKEHQAKEAAALDALWAALDPGQRTAAVAKVRAAHAERDALRAPRPQGGSGNTKMMLQRLSRDLDLDDDQKKKVSDLVAKEPPRLVDPREQVRKYTDAVLAAFEKDAFDAKQLPALDVKMSSGAIGEQAEVVAQLLPLLKPVYAHSTHVPFAKGNGLFTISVLPDDAKLAQEVYLLIQRPSVHDRVNIDEIKLACTSRLALVHRLVLKGVPFRLLERVHFQHSFGPEMDFYQLTLNEEWQHVLREGAVAFYQPPALEKVNAYLFWR